MSIPRGDRQISWMVCERTGRWAAALRVAITRDEVSRRKVTRAHSTHRVTEFRSLPTLRGSLPKGRLAIVLVEVGNENLADVLELFSTHHDQNLRFAALMDDSWKTSTGRTKSIVRDPDSVSDALLEAGAADILQTPRQIARLFPLAARLARAGSCFGKTAGDDSIAEMAKHALPWQDD